MGCFCGRKHLCRTIGLSVNLTATPNILLVYFPSPTTNCNLDRPSSPRANFNVIGSESLGFAAAAAATTTTKVRQERNRDRRLGQIGVLLGSSSSPATDLVGSIISAIVFCGQPSFASSMRGIFPLFALLDFHGFGSTRKRESIASFFFSFLFFDGVLRDSGRVSSKKEVGIFRFWDFFFHLSFLLPISLHTPITWPSTKKERGEPSLLLFSSLLCFLVSFSKRWSLFISLAA